MSYFTPKQEGALKQLLNDISSETNSIHAKWIEKHDLIQAVKTKSDIGGYSMKKIVITMDGGIIQNVLSEEPLEVIVVDYDTEGAEEIVQVLGNEACAVSYPAEENPEEIQRILGDIGADDNE